MKQFNNLVFLLFLTSASLNAQDVITLRTGEQIEVRVTEISPTELRYKRFDNIDGPTRVVPIAEVFAINYENGTREVFNPLTPATSQQGQAQMPATQAQPAYQMQPTQSRPQSANSMQPTKGDMAIGSSMIILSVNDGMDRFSQIGIGAAFLYNASNNFRIAGEIDFFPKREIVTLIDLSVYGHYLIPVSDQFMLYPSLGLGFFGAQAYIFTFSLGGGLEIAINSNLALNSGLRFKLIEGGGYFINVGVGLAYKF